jgi:hypothetical protein
MSNLLKATMLYFVLHLGIGGVCGYTDIKMSEFNFLKNDPVYNFTYTWKCVKHVIVLPPSMPYWIEEVQ